MTLLKLRPLHSGDEEQAVRWAADPVFCAAAGWTPGLAPRVVRQHWQRLIGGSGAEFVRLGVVAAGTKAAPLLGYVDLAHLTRQSAELGVVIGERPSWGQGLGTQACRLLLHEAFAVRRLAFLTAEVHAPNTRSHALMRRLGFVAVGYGEPEAYQGQRVEVVRYRLDRPTP